MTNPSLNNSAYDAPTSQRLGDPTRDFDAFRNAVFADDALRVALQACASMDDLIALSQTLGAARGYSFDRDTVVAAANRSRRDWIEQWIT